MQKFSTSIGRCLCSRIDSSEKFDDDSGIFSLLGSTLAGRREKHGGLSLGRPREAWVMLSPLYLTEDAQTQTLNDQEMKEQNSG